MGAIYYCAKRIFYLQSWTIKEGIIVFFVFGWSAMTNSAGASLSLSGPSEVFVSFVRFESYIYFSSGIVYIWLTFANFNGRVIYGIEFA